MYTSSTIAIVQDSANLLVQEDRQLPSCSISLGSRLWVDCCTGVYLVCYALTNCNAPCKRKYGRERAYRQLFFVSCHGFPLDCFESIAFRLELHLLIPWRAQKRVLCWAWPFSRILPGSSRSLSMASNLSTANGLVLPRWLICIFDWVQYSSQFPRNATK